jgi:glycosyltransferase involved in cell wall biosynthesis
MPQVPDTASEHSISIVIPVYQGETTLSQVVEELLHLTETSTTPSEAVFRVTEILLVHDSGPDGSDEVMRSLEHLYPVVRAIWLSRNFGQHAATLAGIASSSGDWVVTLDEDGQHDPLYIPAMLDTALTQRAAVVYARPVNHAPHGALRNAASKGSKWVLDRAAGGANARAYQSYRLLLGSIARSVAAYAGSGAYLDIAIGWVTTRVAVCDVTLRSGGERKSGYNYRRLASHFWRMVLSSGTRGLRLVSILGAVFALAGLAMSIVILVARLTASDFPEGWASTIVIILVTSGATLFALGVIAEYIGVNVNMAMGKPPYVIVGDPEDGPLGRRRLLLP